MVDGTKVVNCDRQGQAGLALHIHSVAIAAIPGLRTQLGTQVTAKRPRTRAPNKRPPCYPQRTEDAAYTFQAGFLIIRAYARGSPTIFACRISATK